MTMRSYSYILLFSVLLLLSTQINAQTTSFTYQGKITDSSVTQPTSGSYDMQFRLWDNPSAGQGTQQGSTVSNLGVPVNGSIFTVNLDFGSAVFAAGANLYLEISIRTAGSQGGYTSLGPRQRFTSVPYSIQSLKATNATTADTATDSNQLGGIAANQYVLSEDPRLTDSRNPLPGSSNYIQNGTTTQATSNFSISGNGTASGTLSGNVVNATTQFNIGANRVLSTPFTSNLFIGTSTGASNTTGTSNTLIGSGANVAANNLTFATALGAGSVASANNTVTLGRALDTVMIPGSLTIGGTFTANIFNAVTQFNIGGNRMLSSPGTNNIFAGNGAGTANTSGQANSFVGFSAGNDNTTGSFNAFFGANAGAANTTAINNSFFGQGAGFKNTTASDNTFIGNGAGLNTTTGASNTFVGSLAGQATVGGGNNTFVGINAGKSNVGSSSNTFIGANSANSNLTGSGNTYVGTNTDGGFLTSNGTAIGNNAIASQTNSTAIGANSFAGVANSLILGGVNGINGSTSDTLVGIGTTTPNTKLYIKDTNNSSITIDSSSVQGAGITLDNRSSSNNGTAVWRMFTNSYSTVFSQNSSGSSGDVLTINPRSVTNGDNGNGDVFVHGDFRASGTATVDILGTGGSASLCWNFQFVISACSSSLRYKKEINSFKNGLSLLNRLNPITFRWKSDNTLDLGFGAEDVAKVEPLLVTHNKQGEIEGVKYDRISAVLVNAVKEQQVQIELLEKQICDLRAIVSSHLSAIKGRRVSKGKKHVK